MFVYFISKDSGRVSICLVCACTNWRPAICYSDRFSQFRSFSPSASVLIHVLLSRCLRAFQGGDTLFLLPQLPLSAVTYLPTNPINDCLPSSPFNRYSLEKMPLSGENRFHPLINSVALGGRREGRPMSPLPSLLICILALVLCFPGLMLAIRPDRVYPESESTRVEALFGANVTLRCPFELEGADQLYSIKWHKKLNGSYVEFYSYSKCNQTINEGKWMNAACKWPVASYWSIHAPSDAREHSFGK